MMTNKTSISIVINAHKEGSLIFPTVKSALACVDELYRSHSFVDIDFMFYLDNADPITTDLIKSLVNDIDHKCSLVLGSNGDPGLSRMDAVRKSSSDFIAFLDGDDLWSLNWLKNSFDTLIDCGFSKNMVLHPEFNYIFGGDLLLVRQGILASNIQDKQAIGFMRLANYWDALCITSRELLLNNPIPSNEKQKGFAHEDFLWNCNTILAGIEHIIVDNTIHFKRRRRSSVSSQANANSARVKPTSLSKYSYYL